jgi:hypothetical protein
LRPTPHDMRVVCTGARDSGSAEAVPPNDAVWEINTMPDMDWVATEGYIVQAMRGCDASRCDGGPSVRTKRKKKEKGERFVG